MSASRLDDRARDAARAARASVVPLEQVLLNSDLGPRRRSRTRIVAFGAVAAMLVAGIAVLTIDRRSTETNVATGPEATGPARPSTVPPSSGPPPHVSGTVLATGTSRDGHDWALANGDPSNDLCLTVEIGAGSRSTSICTARLAEAPPIPDEEYVPQLMNDARVPGFVFGRMPPGVERVELASFRGEQLGQGDVIAGPGGPFYVIELAARTMPDQVIGYRSDGSSVHYSAFCQLAPRPDVEVPESYVGSPQHRMYLEVLVRNAPPAISNEVRRLHDYVEANVRPENPDSQLIVNWPADVRTALERLQRFIRENCH